MVWLGIDISTSAVKAVLVDDAGADLAQATAPLTIERPQPRWSGQYPDAWWAPTRTAVLDLPARLRLAVGGAGLSGKKR